MRIGIDFDNTIACYGDVFAITARDLGLVNADFHGDKAAVKAALITPSGDETGWMRVQGQVYGAYLERASVYPGVREFLARAVAAGAELLIISQKTEFGHFDPARINLRDAARGWLAARGISGAATMPVAADQVYFEATRTAKVVRIDEAGCTHFIDDLHEVLSHPDFPRSTRRILFRTGGETAEDCSGMQVCTSWNEIEERIFGPDH